MRDFLEQLMARGDVAVVDREVDPRFELAAVTERFQADSDRPLLFRRVRGTAFQVVTNLYGSRARLREIIGAGEAGFCPRWAELLKGPAPETSAVLDDGGELLHGRIGDLPQIVHFERDAGPYITSAVFLAREPETGIPNLSFHRAMMIGDRELRIRLGRSHHLTMYQAKAEAMGKPLEAAMLIGPPPEVFLAAAAPVAYDEDEIAVAAKLGRKPVAMRHCRTSDLTVPAETEIVIEGRILPHVRRREGPFGEFMGYYVPEDDNHVFEVLDVSWRPGAAYHSLLCGSPEDLNTLELAVATTIYQRVSAALPGILDVACHSHIMQTVVKIRQQYEGHARQVLIAALAANFDWSKICTVVDEDVDIHDLNDVMWAFATRGRADTAAFTVPAVPGFYRDPHKDYWGRLCLDATKPWGREAEFARKRIPGADAVDLRNYVR